MNRPSSPTCSNPKFKAKQIAQQIIDGSWDTLPELQKHIERALRLANAAGTVAGIRRATTKQINA